MGKGGFLERLDIVRSSFKKDILFFLIPFGAVLCGEMYFCARDGLTGFWRTLWDLLTRSQSVSATSGWEIAGLILFFFGMGIILTGHIMLWRNYSSFLVIHKDHQLVTRGIYHIVRNPIYLGTFIACLALAIYASSLFGFLIALLLIPVFLIRIRLEEKLLAEEFKQAFADYRKHTRKLIPFIY